MEDQVETHIEEEVELISAVCCVCDRGIDVVELGMNPEDVTEDEEFYCGGSPRCCP